MTTALRAAPKNRRPAGARRPIRRNREGTVQGIRRAIQLGVVLLCVWIGVEFFFFVRHLESGGASPWIERPPGAEAFLPISALMSLRHLLITGELHGVHPAGLFVFAAIVLVSFVFGKAFCSWVCPFGLLSETLGNLGERLLRRRLVPPRWIDRPLRGLKYLLLGFFVYAIFFLMSPSGLRTFLDSPYNQVSDVKMFHFFARISTVAALVIAALLLLSIPIRGFWCRYLCPYGGLTGLLSLASPHKIRRASPSCIDCAKCTKACPALIDVARVGTVVSDECSTCLACVDACPVADTLVLENVVTRRRVPVWAVPAATVVIFAAVTGAAIATGNWQNDISREEYLHHQRHLDSYGHPRSTESIAEWNEHGAPAPVRTIVSEPESGGSHE
jgi:polyferredoxin